MDVKRLADEAKWSVRTIARAEDHEAAIEAINAIAVCAHEALENLTSEATARAIAAENGF